VCAAIGLGAWAVTLAESLDAERAAGRASASALEVLSDEGTRRYPLEGARGMLAVTETGRAALVVSSLPRAPAGTTYEAWVVHRGEALPSGIFTGGGKRSVVAITRPVPDGALLAVSLERAGGAERMRGTLLFEARTT
jgi:hypothetical protein